MRYASQVVHDHVSRRGTVPLLDPFIRQCRRGPRPGSVAQHCDIVHVMEAGELIRSGVPGEVLEAIPEAM
jgi:hypothetical protein